MFFLLLFLFSFFSAEIQDNIFVLKLRERVLLDMSPFRLRYLIKKPRDPFPVPDATGGYGKQSSVFPHLQKSPEEACLQMDFDLSISHFPVITSPYLKCLF